VVRRLQLAPGGRSGHADSRVVGGRFPRDRSYPRHRPTPTGRRWMAVWVSDRGDGWRRRGDGQVAQLGIELAEGATEDRLAG